MPSNDNSTTSETPRSFTPSIATGNTSSAATTSIGTLSHIVTVPEAKNSVSIDFDLSAIARREAALRFNGYPMDGTSQISTE